MDKKDFLYKELSFKLIGCFYDVYNELGPAHKERVYHEALKIAFDDAKVPYDDKPKIKLKFRNKKVGIYEPDFVVEKKIIIEIKSLPILPKVTEKQLYYYLRGTEYKVGYLVNFGAEKIMIKRRIYDSARNYKPENLNLRESALDMR